jgi:lantibiotic modifying enzyme
LAESASCGARGRVRSVHGNAGTILFFQELARSTGDHRYREAALTGAGYIAAQIDNLRSSDLFHGLAGAAFALHQIVPGEQELLDSLNRVEFLQLLQRLKCDLADL